MSKWIKKGDSVVVIAGNDKGKEGKVAARSKDRLIVEGVNVRKKHVKRQQNQAGGQIVEIEAPIHISNVALTDGKGAKIKVRKRVGKNKVELVYKAGEKLAVHRVIKNISGKQNV